MEIAVMYGIARNASGRATVMHEFRDGQTCLTGCGSPSNGWSVSWVPIHIARGALVGMLCGSCGRRK